MAKATDRDLAASLPSSWGPDNASRPLVVFAQRCEAGPGRAHRHPRHHQLIYATTGVMRVSTAHGLWVVPPERAVWVPAEVEHRVEATAAFDICTLYVAAHHRPELPTSCRVVAVPLLLRELLRSAAAFGDSYPAVGPQSRLLEVMLDQIKDLDVLGMKLPTPQDRRLLRIAQAVHDDPGQTTTLADWGKDIGASARTLERLFRAETGMTFTAWRAQARLISALDGLSRGHSVTEVAMASGYEDVSSFISMFRKALGVTPKAYFRP